MVHRAVFSSHRVESPQLKLSLLIKGIKVFQLVRNGLLGLSAKLHLWLNFELSHIGKNLVLSIQFAFLLYAA